MASRSPGGQWVNEQLDCKCGDDQSRLKKKEKINMWGFNGYMQITENVLHCSKYICIKTVPMYDIWCNHRKIHNLDVLS